jgi:hypothetical protein
VGNVTRRMTTVKCLFCGKKFETKLRWEGLPEKDYCSTFCEEEDEALDGQSTFEKFTKSNNEKDW